MSYKKSKQELVDILASIDSTRVTVQRLQTIEKRLPRFEEDIKKLSKRMEISMSLLPEKKEIPALLTRISKLGSQSGLEFMNFQPGNERMQHFYAEVPVAIVVKGGVPRTGHLPGPHPQLAEDSTRPEAPVRDVRL